MRYLVEELWGNDAYGLGTFDTREEAEHFMIESAGNDVTQEHGNEILECDETYARALENALSYYAVMEM